MDNLTDSNSTILLDSCLESIYCTPMMIVLAVLSFIGMLSNLIVLVVVIREKRLHKPIYIGITALTIPDFTFLLIRFLKITMSEYFKQVKTKEVAIVKNFLNTVLISAFMSSIVHVVLLSLKQYFLIAFPLKSHVWFTNKKIMMTSLIVWCCCITLGITYVYVVVVNRLNDPEAANVMNSSLTIIMTFLPIVLIGIFHILKAKSLRSSLSDNRSKTVKKMSRIVTLVIACYLITTLPINVKDILEITLGYQTEVWFIVFYHVATIFLFCNYLINPFIYFLNTPQFKKAFNQCFGNKLSHLSRWSVASNSNKSYTLSSSLHSDTQQPCVATVSRQIQR